MEESKRKLIFNAAIDLFVEQGFENTSIQDIANSAGIAKGTVYLYFKSKSDLIHQLYNHCYMMDVEACKTGMELEKGALAKLCRRLDNIISYALNHPKETKIEHLYILSPVYCNDPLHSHKMMTDDIRTVVQEGIQHNEFKDLSVDFLTRIYYHLILAIYEDVLENPDKWELYSFRKQCYQMISDTMC